MPPAAPSFPTFDEWKRMSEREQDALLDSLEARGRRGMIGRRVLLGLGAAVMTLALMGALILMSVG
jgi:hypothetical protein